MMPSKAKSVMTRKSGLYIVMFSSFISMMGISTIAEAAYYPVDITSITNTNIQQRNPLYPDGNFETSFGVPFNIAADTDNAWGSGNGIGGASGNHGIWTATVDVHQANVATIYTLANTDWGWYGGQQRFSITANFDDGRSLSWIYTDQNQLRDWNLYGPGLINGADTNEVFRVSPPSWVFDGNPDVLDMQALAVPSEYQSTTLETLVLVDDRETFVHSVFVAGITLSDSASVTASALNPVPVPGSFLLMLSGFGLLRLFKIRNKSL
jgi:hypothetical protein